MPDTNHNNEKKTAADLLLAHYLRTGQYLQGATAVKFLEHKFNQNHDPSNGRFTFGSGGAGYRGLSTAAVMGGRSISPPYPVRVKLPSAQYPIRIDLPPAKPLQPINTGKQSPQHSAYQNQTGRDFWLAKDSSVRVPETLKPKIDAVASDYHAATGKTLVLTDGIRKPHDQASGMYYKFSHGDFHTYGGDTTRHVAEVYRDGARRGRSRAETINRMADEIKRRITPAHPLSRHLFGQGIDFSVRGMTRADIEVLKRAIKKHDGQVIHENVPPHVHGSF
jgi:hypothetical protein